MTRANANQWFTDAGAANSIVPIARFVSPTIFATKTRGYGCLFELAGADEEGLTDSELNARVRAVEMGLRRLPEGSSLYQYMRVTSGFEIPRQDKYTDPITQSFVDHRLDFLEKTANFRRIDLHWCLTFEPELSNPFAAKPKDQANENERLITQLQKAATILETHLSGAIGRNPVYSAASLV
jgi:type IV secretion system protein VirB4